MKGGIIGDIIGSRFEANPRKSTNFELFRSNACQFTDDTVLTIAIADALLTERNYAANLKKWARAYPKAGYGGMFKRWSQSEDLAPYNSYGNGSAMRVSPVAYVGKSMEEVMELAKETAIVTHSHPEGIKGAQATACAIFLALERKSKDQIKEFVQSIFNYNLKIPVNKIRPSYRVNVTCQRSVPQAIRCFYEGNSYEEVVRLAISLGGDTDTQAAIAGGIAEAYYGIPDSIEHEGLSYLTEDLYTVVQAFYSRYVSAREQRSRK